LENPHSFLGEVLAKGLFKNADIKEKIKMLTDSYIDMTLVALSGL